MSLGLFTSRQLQRVVRLPSTSRTVLKRDYAGGKPVSKLRRRPISKLRNNTQNQERRRSADVSEIPARPFEENLNVAASHLTIPVLESSSHAYGNNFTGQFRFDPEASPKSVKHGPKRSFNKFKERQRGLFQRLDSLDAERFLPDRSYTYPNGQAILHDYLAIRKLGLVKYLRSQHYIIIAKEVAYRKLSGYLEWLVEDLFSAFPCQADPLGFVKVATTIMILGNTQCPLLPNILLKLFNEVIILKPTEPLALPNAAWVGIYQAALKYPDNCRFTLESLADAFFAGQRAAGRLTFTLINLTNTILIELLLKGQDYQSEALGVFRKLIEHGLVPNIQDGIDADDASFKMVIVRSIIRGYIATGIYFKAFEHIERLLQDPRWAFASDTTEADRTMTASLAIEVLNATLLRPWKQEVAICGRVISMLTPKTDQAEKYCITSDVPDSTVLGFYDACRYFNLPIEAASVFVHLRSPEIHARHPYLPPRGTALVWLLEYFSDPGTIKPCHTDRQSFRGRIDMAKAILQDVVALKASVPVNDRPKVLAIAALRGFAFEARFLYDLWTNNEDPDCLMVRGSAKMLAPLVKLFMHLQGNWDRNLTKAKPHQNRGQGAGWLFATRVVDSYMQTKNPIQQASQMDLNALARALVELDRIVEAFAVLHIVVRRLDIPDIKDINVALLAIARHSVPRAVWTLEYMIAQGVMPTASTFSALIHTAVNGNQRHLIPQLLERAKSLGFGELTPKGVATLVHAELEQPHPKSKKGEAIHHVRNELIWELVQTVMGFSSEARQRSDHGKDHVLSVRMGTRYVQRALAAKDGRLAMEFWRALLKERTGWWDENAVNIRRGIAGVVNLQESAGHLREGEAKRLLEELHARDKVT